MPILKHAAFMAKKSMFGAYRHETFTEYDKLVWRQADRDGLKEFGLLATEEIATCFCPENMFRQEKPAGVSGHDVVKDGVGVDKNVDFTEGNLAGYTDTLVYVTPKSSKRVSIEIYKSCIDGNCTCVFELGSSRTELKPCRFRSLIFVDWVPSDVEIEVFKSIIHGVDIVSSSVDSYECENYKSISVRKNQFVFIPLVLSVNLAAASVQ